MRSRPVFPNAACPMSGYVARPSWLSKHLRRRIPVYQDTMAKMRRIPMPSQPPSLKAYGVVNTPTPHNTFTPVFHKGTEAIHYYMLNKNVKAWPFTRIAILEEVESGRNSMLLYSLGYTLSLALC